MKTAFRLLLCASLAVCAAGASAADMLAGKNGMTLYTFDKDSNGRSACAAACLAAWPAARPGDSSGPDFGEIQREDGSKQLTHKGKPLYYYAGDKKPGDTTGDKMQNVWHALTSDKRKAAQGYDYGNASSYGY